MQKAQRRTKCSCHNLCSRIFALRKYPSGDGILQPGETAIVSYDIINVTPREITLLIPKMELSNQAKRIHISTMQNITNIPSGEGVRYSVTLTAYTRLKRGETSLTLSLSRDETATFIAMNTIQISTKK